MRNLKLVLITDSEYSDKHPDETADDVIKFAQLFDVNKESGVEVVYI